MQFQTLLCAKVGNKTIYFDGNGMLYEKHPILSHYTATGQFVYYEYYNQPIFILMPYCGAVGALDYDIEYTVDDEQNQIKGESKNGSK